MDADPGSFSPTHRDRPIFLCQLNNSAFQHFDTQSLNPFSEATQLINDTFISYKGKFCSTTVIKSYTSEIEGSTFISKLILYYVW